MTTKTIEIAESYLSSGSFRDSYAMRNYTQARLELTLHRAHANPDSFEDLDAGTRLATRLERASQLLSMVLGHGLHGDR